MRDPKRIDKLLNIIRLVWSECPDLRLTQLILNSLHKSDQIVISSNSVFHIEDEALMKAIYEYGLEFVKDNTADFLYRTLDPDGAIKQWREKMEEVLEDHAEAWEVLANE